MAKNDMPVIIYKILKYLYECMKAGKQPDEMDFCAESKLISIPLLYWNCVIREMYDNGFVRGVSVLSTKDGPLIILDSDFNITLKGVEFLEDNTLMQKVREHLGTAIEVTIGTLVKAII